MCISGEPFAVTGDLIADVCHRFRQLDVDISELLASRVEREAREAYGRERVYVANHAQRDKARALEGVVQGRPVREMAKEFGVNRVTIYRHLKRRQSK